MGCPHSGADMRAPTGTKLYSPVDGVVYEAYSGFAKNEGTGNGNFIRINADNGTQVVMIHLLSVERDLIPDTESPEQSIRVSAGQLVGRSNATAAPGQPHLHITIHKDQSGPKGFRNTKDPVAEYGGQGCKS